MGELFMKEKTCWFFWVFFSLLLIFQSTTIKNGRLKYNALAVINKSSSPVLSLYFF